MKLFTFFIIKILIVFFILAIAIKNYEFIYYDAILLPLVLIIYFIYKKIRLHLPVFILICAVILMHAAGGVLHFNGTRLYDIVFGFLRYDNIVHFLGSFVVVFIVYNLIYNFIPVSDKKRGFYLFIILVFMTMGFGTLIEFVELFAVIFLGASKGVGGYMNNAIDLVVNFVGAICAALVVVYYHKNKTFGELVWGKIIKNDS